MSNNPNASHKLFTSRIQVPSTTYVGESGRMFYNENTGELRLSDGVTPGGTQIKFSATGANIGDLVITGASITSINPNEDISLVSNGSGNVNVFGSFLIHSTANTVPFAVSQTGSLTVRSPAIPANAPGALNIIGSTTGAFQNITSAGGLLHLTGNDGAASAPARITLDSYNSIGSPNIFPVIVGRSARGTADVPTQSLVNDILMRIAGGSCRSDTGFGVPGSVSSTSFEIVSLDNCSEAVRGTAMKFYNAPLGGNTRVLCGTIDTTGFISTGNITAAHNLIAANLIVGSISNVSSITANSITTLGNISTPNTPGDGLLINGAYGWRDLIGAILPRATGATAPKNSIFTDSIRGWSYNAGDQGDITYHIPHDYAPGTDLFIHLHWSHNGASIAGNLQANISATYAPRTDAPPTAYSAPVSPFFYLTSLDINNSPQYMHRVDEIQFSTPGGSTTLLDTNQIAVDGVININYMFNEIPAIANSPTSVNVPFLWQIDIHHQSITVATKNRTPNFYT